MRLDKYLANSGLGSRSQVKRLIKDKRITVNGELVKKEDFNIDETKDVVCFDNEIIHYKEFYYILLNKPQGYVSAVEDNVYPPITDLIPEFSFANLYPVGRLDVDTIGAILLTNNGDICHKLLSPRYCINKTYAVEVDKKLDKNLINIFKDGIMLDDEKTLPAELVIIDSNHAELTIHQGKFHQVKRMFKQFGYNVITLERKTFAFLDCKGLELGEWRELTQEEEQKLINLVK